MKQLFEWMDAMDPGQFALFMFSSIVLFAIVGVLIAGCIVHIIIYLERYYQNKLIEDYRKINQRQPKGD